MNGIKELARFMGSEMQFLQIVKSLTVDEDQDLKVNQTRNIF